MSILAAQQEPTQPTQPAQPQDTSVTPQPQEVPVTQPKLIVQPDGKFSEDWMASLPEDLQKEESLGIFKDIGGLARSLVSAQKMVGKTKIVIPTEKSTPEEWGEFYSKLGRPETKDKYDISPPSGVEFDGKLIDGFREQAHNLGLSGKQAKELFNWYANSTVDQLKNFSQQSELDAKEAVSSLRKEWGLTFDQNIKSAQRAASEFGLTEELNKAGLGNNVAVVKALAKIGEQFSEDRPIGNSHAIAPVDAKVEINKVMGDKTHPYHDSQSPAHADAVEQMRKLFEAAYSN